MADRTIQMIGQAYAASGDVSVVMTVGGVEVFNGNVSDSSTVREGEPSTENVLWTWTQDESVSGDLAVSITVSGGELCLGPVKYNMVKKAPWTDDWYNTNVRPYLPPGDISLADAIANGYTEEQWNDIRTNGMPVASQSALADYCTEGRLGSTLFNALKAGTVAWATEEQQTAIFNAAYQGDAANYYQADDDRLLAAVNGTSLNWSGDELKQAWAILEDGDVFTYTWRFDPDTVYQ